MCKTLNGEVHKSLVALLGVIFRTNAFIFGINPVIFKTNPVIIRTSHVLPGRENMKNRNMQRDANVCNHMPTMQRYRNYANLCKNQH